MLIVNLMSDLMYQNDVLCNIKGETIQGQTKMYLKHFHRSFSHCGKITDQ